MTTYLPGITIPSAVLQHPAASVLLPIALGSAVGLSTRPNETQKQYLALRQPPLHPPPWIFGPVWTALYGLMGYASYRVASVGLSPLASPELARITRHSLTAYTVQLGLNLVWMPLFFVAKRPIEATVDIVTLLGLNSYLAYLWGSVDSVAGLSHLPYIGWLSFATYLCAGAGHLNGWDFSNKNVRAPSKRQ